jgi:lipopolysaccharide/colanic/teichoic acid biosynthesis glycosyltransferase
MKRIFDVLFSGFVLLCFMPIGLVLAILILVESKGGVFFKQVRIGKNGTPFYLFKFRSMFIDAESMGKITIGSRDPRITRVGFYIRRYKLDEFPQFINVIRGEMSIVGPRPEVKEYVDLYSEEQRKILAVKPGITDYASITYFHENEILAKSENPQQTYIQEVMPEKIKLNEKYLANPTLLQDISIIRKTVVKMFFSRKNSLE